CEQRPTPALSDHRRRFGRARRGGHGDEAHRSGRGAAPVGQFRPARRDRLMSRDDLSRLLRWYPQGWRARYGDELITYMEDNYGDRRPPMRDRLSVVLGGLRERAQQAGLSGESVPPEERMRAAVLLILAAWAGFVLAGLSFAKLSEHFDDALPG